MQGGHGDTWSDHTVFAFCYSALLRSDCKTEQERLLLCSGFAWRWQVPWCAQWSWSLGTHDGGNLANIHNILQAMGREQCWGMWTVEELELTFSFGTACSPRPHNVKSPKIAWVQKWYRHVSLPFFPSPKHRNSLTVTQGYTEPPGANHLFYFQRILFINFFPTSDVISPIFLFHLHCVL